MAHDTTKNHPVGEGLGAAAGHGVAAVLNPTMEDVYWQQTYASRPYVRDGAPYTAYMSFYARLRVDIRSERLDVARKEQQTDADGPPSERTPT